MKLGRGLDALLNQKSESAGPGGEALTIPLDQIQANPHQPRTDFDPASLQALADSVKRRGVLQPVLVRQVAEGYQLVAGERRWRAAIEAGLDAIPARVIVADDNDMFELALIENVQRDDLNAIEKAQSFRTYMEAFELTQQQLAERLGMDRASVANFVRLLDLPEDIQVAIREGLITMGHGRALLSVADPAKQAQLLRQIIEQNLSVRDVESQASSAAPKRATRAKRRQKTAHVRRVEDDLTRRLSAKVSVREGRKNGTGAITIGFKSDAEFQRLIDLLYESGN